MKDTAVNLEVSYGTQHFDLRVPSRVSLKRVEALLAPIMAQQHVALPARWHLRLVSKRITLSDQVPLNHYAIANGDRFEVSAQEEDQID